MNRLALLCVLLAAACGQTIDPDEVPSVADYASWPSFEIDTDVPGHADSIRVIYKNEVAASYPHGGRYPAGTVILKEIFDRKDDGSRGSLRYIGIARKLAPGSGLPTDDGWLFTQQREPGAEETQLDLCWSLCHRVGPYDGLWFDYGD
jgi:hypothetical protein